MAGTLREARDDNAEIHIHCSDRRCLHSGKADIAALIQLLGEDHGAMHNDLVGLFRCSKCKAEGRPGRQIWFTHHQDHELLRKRFPWKPAFPLRGQKGT